MNIDQKLYSAIKQSGIDLLLSVPCAMIKGLLQVIDDKNEIPHISVTREEEGVGIAAGAYLGGKVPALLMQNSGLGNSINAIKSLLELYEIPIIFIMSHRGAEGEKILAQIPMGQLTLSLLECIDVGYIIIDSEEKIDDMIHAIKKSQNSNKSIAIVLKRTLWGAFK